MWLKAAHKLFKTTDGLFVGLRKILLTLSFNGAWKFAIAGTRAFLIFMSFKVCAGRGIFLMLLPCYIIYMFYSQVTMRACDPKVLIFCWKLIRLLSFASSKKHNLGYMDIKHPSGTKKKQRINIYHADKHLHHQQLLLFEPAGAAAWSICSKLTLISANTLDQFNWRARPIVRIEAESVTWNTNIGPFAVFNYFLPRPSVQTQVGPRD